MRVTMVHQTARIETRTKRVIVLELDYDLVVARPPAVELGLAVWDAVDKLLADEEAMEAKDYGDVPY